MLQSMVLIVCASQWSVIFYTSPSYNANRLNWDIMIILSQSWFVSCPHPFTYDLSLTYSGIMQTYLESRGPQFLVENWEQYRDQRARRSRQPTFLQIIFLGFILVYYQVFKGNHATRHRALEPATFLPSKNINHLVIVYHIAYILTAQHFQLWNQENIQWNWFFSFFYCYYHYHDW